MTEFIPFTRASQRRAFEELARGGRALELRIAAGGAVGELVGVTTMRIARGRILELEGAAHDAKDALLRVAFAELGEIAVELDRLPLPTEPIEEYPDLLEWYAEAESGALALAAHLKPLGGLDRRLLLRSEALGSFRAELPEAALPLAMLANGKRVADVLQESLLPDLATASLLEKLAARGVLEVQDSPGPPSPISTMTGWDEGAPPSPPGPARSMGQRPAPAAMPALVDAPLIAPAGSADDSTISAALGPRLPWAWLLVAFALLGIVLLLLNRSEPPPVVAPPPPVAPAPPPPPPVKTTTTATIAKPALVEIDGKYSLSHPPPVTGPSSDARLREAERLLRGGRFDAAGKLLTELREALPGSVEVWVLSAMLAAELERWKDSMRFAEHALQIDPRSYRALVIKGFVHQSQRGLLPAIDAYRRALKLEPDHPMSPELRSVADRLERDGLPY